MKSPLPTLPAGTMPVLVDRLDREGRRALSFQRPSPSSTTMLTMKKYVGTAKSRPDSRTPRRLPYAISSNEADRDLERVRRERRERRAERGGPCRDRHRDGEDVVGEERDAGDLCGEQPEVVARDDVRAAGATGTP